MTVLISYSGGLSSHFDRTYYRERHLPLVMKSWEQYGLLGLAALYPEKSEEGIIAICVCTFQDDDAAKTAFGSTEAAAVMADVKHFTDISPTQSKSVPLGS